MYVLSVIRFLRVSLELWIMRVVLNSFTNAIKGLKEVKVMSDRELYLVWHDQGWPGSWLLWFINMHTNFPQFEGRYSYSRLNNPLLESLAQHKHPLHFLTNGCYWKNETFDEHITKWIIHNDTQDNVNKQSTKIVLRFWDHSPRCAKKLKSKISPQVKGNIGMVAGEAYDKIYNRMLDLKKHPPGPCYSLWRILEKDDISRRDNVNIKYDFSALEKIAPTHIVDFSKLLNYDEKEYNGLVKFIEEKPLKNWKEHVKVITTIFDRY